MHAFKLRLNILCVFICNSLFSFIILRSINIMCIAVVHFFFLAVVHFYIALYDYVSSYVSFLLSVIILGCSLIFAISNDVVLNILCISSGHACFSGQWF